MLVKCQLGKTLKDKAIHLLLRRKLSLAGIVVLLILAGSAVSGGLRMYVGFASAFLGSKRQTMVLGEDGWCFFRKTLQYHLFPWPNTRQAVVDIAKRYEQQGVKLLVVPVPNKLEIYPEKLLGYFPGDVQHSRRRKLIAWWKAQGVHAIDIQPLLTAAKDSLQTYGPFDTHWNSFGRRLVARHLGEVLVQSGFTVQEQARYSICDTMVYLPDRSAVSMADSSLMQRQYPEPEQYPCGDGVQSTSDSSAATKVIMIFGDSFSYYGQSYNAHLAAWLGNELGVKDIPTVHTLYGGAEGPAKLNQYLGRGFKDYKYVIWVFASRSFLTGFAAVKGATDEINEE